MNHIAFITGPADFLNLYSFLQQHRMQDDTIAIVLFGTAHNVSKDLKEATQKLSRPLDNASFYFLKAVFIYPLVGLLTKRSGDKKIRLIHRIVIAYLAIPFCFWKGVLQRGR